jgi:universal stress protein A
MTKTKTILCPTDFSENAASAFCYAQELAYKLDSVIELIHVYHTPLYGKDISAPTKLEAMDPALREKLEYDLREFAEQNAQVKVPVTYKLRVGIPSHEILEEADQLDVVMIIIGVLGITGLQRLLMGSVAEQVVRLANHPVLTVRSKANRMRYVSSS